MKTINGTVNFPPTLNCALTRALMVAGFLLGTANGFPQALLTTQAAPPETIVTLAAGEAGLAQVAPADLPSDGTYYWILAGGSALPMPLPPQDGSAIFQVTPNIFIADQTGGQIITGPHRPGTQAANVSLASVAASQADSVMGLINQIQSQAATPQTRSMARAMGMGVPTPGDGGDGGSGDGGGSGDYTNNYVAYTFDHSLLWLGIVNSVNGWTCLTLNHGTNQVYAIWSTTNIATPFAVWNVATEVWPTNLICMPFMVATLGRTDQFFKAEDWTGVMQNGLYCWWTWQNFGDLSETSTDVDSGGVNTLGYDYTNGLDPNVISFTVRLGNQNFNSPYASGSFLVLGGVPSYAAVLVNDTNLNDAVWQPYNGNIFMELGPTDGVYQVQFGLKGRAADSQATWMGTQVTLNRQVPQVFITSPTNTVVAQPYVLLQGYATLPLASVTFDVSNAVAVLTNQLGAIIQHTLDTNTLAYTTDYFECVDILLTTNGPNLITVHATDPAGNTTSTTLNLALNYATATNPVVSLAWPQDGMEISGDTFTLRGQVDDSSAAVSATITDEDGNTTTAYGLVERDGTLWVDDLPLAEGENDVALTVVNSAGLPNETDFTVVKSDMTLTLDTITGDLWQPWVNVGGSIFDPGYAVSVNGVPGTNNGDGTWSAFQVPVSASGEASFDVVATPPVAMFSSRLTRMSSSPSSNPVNANRHLDKPDAVKLESGNWSAEWNDDLDDGLGGALEYSLNVWNWSRLAGGLENDFWEGYHAANTNYVTQMEIYHILPDRTVPLEHVASVDTSWPPGNTNFDVTNVTLTSSYGAFEWLHEVPQEEGALSYHPNPYTGFTEHGSANLERFSGGRLPNGDESLYVLDGTVTEKIVLPNGLIVYSNVPPQQVTVDMLGNLDASGEAKKMLPTQTKRASNLTADVPRSTDNVTAALRYRPRILLQRPDQWGVTDITSKTITAIVGQKFSLNCQVLDANGNPPPATSSVNYTWTVPGYAVSSFYVSDDLQQTNGYPILLMVKTNASVDYCWADQGSKLVQCAVQIGSQTFTAKTTFSVLRPTATVSSITGTVAVNTNYIYDFTNGDMPDHELTLHFGDNSDTSKGIIFSDTFTMPSGISYNFGNTNYDTEWVQLISPSTTTTIKTGEGVLHTLQSIGPLLDTTYPYTFLNRKTTDDSPSTPPLDASYLAASDNLGCKMWLMFRPSGGEWVPLRIVAWNYSGTVTNSGANWILTSASCTTNPPDNDSGTEYPAWYNNVANTNVFQWNPAL
jgi:hypothetical protein